MKTEKKRKSQTSFQSSACAEKVCKVIYVISLLLKGYIIPVYDRIYLILLHFLPLHLFSSCLLLNATETQPLQFRLPHNCLMMCMRFLINWNLTRKQRESRLKLSLSSLDFLSHTRRNDRACVCIPAKRKWNWSRAEPISVSRRLREPLRATHSRTKRNTGPLNPSCGTFYHSLSLPVSLSSYWSVSVGPRMEELAAAWSSPIFRREEANWSLLLRVSRCPASCSGEDVQRPSSHHFYPQFTRHTISVRITSAKWGERHL